MHKSIPAVHIPPPPGHWGAFACLISPRGGALANSAWPRGQAFAYPGANPVLLTRMWFPILIIINMEDFTGNTSRLADWIIYQGHKKLVEAFKSMFLDFMHAFLYLLSRQNIHCQIGSY